VQPGSQGLPTKLTSPPGAQRGWCAGCGCPLAAAEASFTSIPRRKDIARVCVNSDPAKPPNRTNPEGPGGRGPLRRLCSGGQPRSAWNGQPSVASAAGAGCPAPRFGLQASTLVDRKSPDQGAGRSRFETPGIRFQGNRQRPHFGNFGGRFRPHRKRPSGLWSSPGFPKKGLEAGAFLRGDPRPGGGLGARGL